MANRARGETSVRIGSKNVTLCATLGALAEIEDRLDVRLSEIGSRLSNPRIRDIIVIVAALSNGAVTEEQVAKLDVTQMNALGEALGEAFAAMSFGGDEDGSASEGN